MLEGRRHCVHSDWGMAGTAGLSRPAPVSVVSQWGRGALFNGGMNSPIRGL